VSRRIVVLVVGVLVAVLMGACGGAPAAQEEIADDAPAEEESADEFFEEEEAAEEEMAEEEPAIEVTFEAGDASEFPQSQQSDRLIIKNGEISLLVEEVDTALDLTTQVATDNGGYVISNQAYSDDGYDYATITIAVRSDNFETALRRLRSISIEVMNESSTGEDVTAEYTDLESRLDNLEATRDRIRTFLDEAENVNEALAVNEELAQIEEEIEIVQGRINYLRGRATFSTITVNLEEQILATPTPTPTPEGPWSLAPIVDEAVETQVTLGRGLAEAATWSILVCGPYVVIVGLILGAGRWAYVAFFRREKSTTQAPIKNTQDDE